MNKFWIIALLNVMTLSSCSQNPEPETYLIPEAFTGRVNIIFHRKDGDSPKYENGRRVYEIPTNGILLTQFKDEYGLVDRKYFYVDSNGKRRALKIFRDETFKDTKSNVNSEEIGIFLDGTTGQYGKPPKAVWWQEFILTNYNNLDSFFTPKYKKQFEDRLKKATGIDVTIP